MAVPVKQSTMLNQHILNLHHVFQRCARHWSWRDNETPFFKSLRSSGTGTMAMKCHDGGMLGTIRACRKYILSLPERSGLLAQKRRSAQRELLKHPSTEEINITNKPIHSTHHISYAIKGGTSNVHTGG